MTSSEFEKQASAQELSGDTILKQVAERLAQSGRSLPKFGKLPEVRMVVQNIGGGKTFHNPGHHSEKPETIATGKSTMVMLKGNSLQEQNENAATLYGQYDFGNKGLTEEFLSDLAGGKLEDLVAEAYGPTELAQQAGKLIAVDWKDAQGETTTVTPTLGANAAYGTRKIEGATAFRVQIPQANSSNVTLKGTTTVAEKFKGEPKEIVINLTEDWQTKATKTDPIDPSRAKEAFGENFENLPIITLDKNYQVSSINLTPAASAAAKPKAPTTEVA